MTLELIRGWHVVLGLLVALPLIYQRWLAPTIAWRKDMEIWRAQTDMKLEAGSKNFTEMSADIKEMKGCIHRLNTQVEKTNVLLERAVFRGVGEER